MSGPSPHGGLPAFEVAPFDALADLCGDLLGAGLRALFAGNQYMVLPELVSDFLTHRPEPAKLFYETLPPGVLVDQLRSCGLRVGTLELRFTPDLIAAGPRALGALHRDGLVGEPRTYASNVLALLVARGNPHRVTGLADLARPGLRVALPNPQTEGIGRLARRALAAAGGEALLAEITDAKQRSGQTVLTSIHHRQSPAWLADGVVDAALVWQTEARHLTAGGQPVTEVPIEASVNQRGRYAGAVVACAEHPSAASDFLDHLTGPAGRAAYARHGFAAPDGA